LLGVAEPDAVYGLALVFEFEGQVVLPFQQTLHLLDLQTIGQRGAPLSADFAPLFNVCADARFGRYDPLIDTAYNIRMIVLDTNVLVAALRSRTGWSRRMLTQVLNAQLQAGVSVPLFIEYEAVLQRAEQRAAFGLNRAEVDAFLAGLASVLQPIDISFLWRPQLKDPADEMVLEAAVNGQCTHLVTWNLRDFAHATPRFNLKLSTPAEYCQTQLPGKPQQEQ
jgi:putative PIN family toxin of toxin-antitoxin system